MPGRERLLCASSAVINTLIDMHLDMLQIWRRIVLGKATCISPAINGRRPIWTVSVGRSQPSRTTQASCHAQPGCLRSAGGQACRSRYLFQRSLMVQDAHETNFCVEDHQGSADGVGQGKGSLACETSFAGFGF